MEAVEPDTPASEAGFQDGDVIVEVGETALAGPEALGVLRQFLDGLQADGRFVLLRGAERVETKARPRVLPQDVPRRPGSLGYDRPVGIVRAEVVAPNRIEIASRGVTALRLHLAAPLVDFSKDLVVTWNGRTVFEGSPPESGAYLLAQAIRSGPGAPTWRGSLDLGAGNGP